MSVLPVSSGPQPLRPQEQWRLFPPVSPCPRQRQAGSQVSLSSSLETQQGQQDLLRYHSALLWAEQTFLLLLVVFIFCSCCCCFGVRKGELIHISFYGEQLTTDLSAGALAVKESHKGTLKSHAPRMRTHPYDSWYLGLG